MRLYHESAFDFSRTVDSHWEASAPPLGRDLEPLSGRVTVEVAVIGAGFTGLNAAAALARRHGMDVAVLDAGPVGWGASGRNGGFCCMGSAKLSYAEMTETFGPEATREFYKAQRAAVDHVAHLLSDNGIDADRTGTGELQLAHRENRVRGMREEREELKARFGAESRFLDRHDLAACGAASPVFTAGLWSPVGFGLHPLKYVRGLARLALDAGARIFPSSAVLHWREDRGRHVLRTAEGEVSAARVLVATNGYTDEEMPPELAGKLLPALSSILVTRPLKPEELAAQGWRTTDVAYDTRKLLHYFRLLPDNRFLFGGRGGTDASPEALAAISRRLRSTFETMFPAFASAETEKRWSGFVCLAFNRTPYAGPIEGRERAFIAAAYHGNGVAMGSYLGARVADLVAGEQGAEMALPLVVRAPLRRFPAAPLRLHYLKAAYLGFGIRDEWL